LKGRPRGVTVRKHLLPFLRGEARGVINVISLNPFPHQVWDRLLKKREKLFFSLFEREKRRGIMLKSSPFYKGRLRGI